MDSATDITKNSFLDTVRANKTVVGLVVVLLVVIIMWMLFKRESFTPNNVRGWNVEKSVNNFMKSQAHLKKKIMHDRTKNLEYY